MPGQTLFAAQCRGVPWPTEGPENDQLLALLAGGEMTLIGLMPWSSNYTFLGRVREGETAAQVIYKPARGERPLWDFPRGTLGKREVAAYLVSRALGWHFVPPAVLRSGPHGRGSVQLFVSVDQDAHYFIFRNEPAFRHTLQALCLFDVITNNADRKSGHCLRLADGCILAIDQALCFHADEKLRTVIWDFASEKLPADLRNDLERLKETLRRPDSPLVVALSQLLYNGEIAALRRRTEALLAEDRFPDPPEDRRAYPWPLV